MTANDHLDVPNVAGDQAHARLEHARLEKEMVSIRNAIRDLWDQIANVASRAADLRRAQAIHGVRRAHANDDFWGASEDGSVKLSMSTNRPGTGARVSDRRNLATVVSGDRRSALI